MGYTSRHLQPQPDYCSGCEGFTSFSRSELTGSQGEKIRRRLLAAIGNENERQAADALVDTFLAGSRNHLDCPCCNGSGLQPGEV